MTSEQGFVAVRLPPYHRILNPIELILVAALSEDQSYSWTVGVEAQSNKQAGCLSQRLIWMCAHLDSVTLKLETCGGPIGKWDNPKFQARQVLVRWLSPATCSGNFSNWLFIYSPPGPFPARHWWVVKNAGLRSRLEASWYSTCTWTRPSICTHVQSNRQLSWKQPAPR